MKYKITKFADRLFTPSEYKVIVFLIIAILVGSSVRYVRSIMNDTDTNLHSGTICSVELVDDTEMDNTTSDIIPELININTSNETQIASLPGIGMKRAKDIVNYRNEHGKFTTKTDIMNVNGVGKKTFENIENKIEI